MKSNFSRNAYPGETNSSFGNNVRDTILQAQIDNELGAYITVSSPEAASSDGTTVLIQLWSKNKTPLGEPQPITVDAVGNKVVKSIEIKDVTVEGKVEKQLVLTFKGQTDPPAIYCSLKPIYDAIDAEKARALAAEAAVAQLVETETQERMQADTAIELDYTTADAMLAENIAGVEAKIPTKVSQLTDASDYLKKGDLINEVHFVLGADGETLTTFPPITPYEVLALMNAKHIVLGFIVDSFENDYPLGPCTGGLIIEDATNYVIPVFASGSGQFEIVGDQESGWHFNK